MTYVRGSWWTTSFTPWCRAAIAAAGIDRDALRERIPDGWRIGGHASSARGPYSFSLVRDDQSHAAETVMAYRWREIPEALDRLFAKVMVPHG